MNEFFSWDPEDGFETHATADEAKARAQESIDFYRDDASDGWSEDVEQVCWGRIGEVATKRIIEVKDPDPRFADYWDFDLEEIPPPPGEGVGFTVERDFDWGLAIEVMGRRDPDGFKYGDRVRVTVEKIDE